MASTVAAYAAALVALALLDALWLSLYMGPQIQSVLSAVVSPDLKWLPALAFYALYPVGILIFASLPALRDGGWGWGFAMGALFGFFCYATYDLTNLATLRVWSVWIAVQDVAWGAFVTGTAAAAGTLAANAARAA